MENKDEGGQYGVPKFDLEEQAKNFRKDGADVSSTGKSDFETPLGNGTLHFGVTQGPSFGFGSGCRAPASGRSAIARGNSRQDSTDRLAPPTSLEYIRRSLSRAGMTARHTAFAISRNLNF